LKQVIETDKKTIISYSEEEFVKSDIEISMVNDVLPFEQFTFNGGEESIKLSEKAIGFLDSYRHDVNITATLKSSKDVITLLMVTDAIKRISRSKIDLYLAYVPYARQDRVCEAGEAFSLKVFCDLINSQNYSRVLIADPHSDVTPALLNNVEVVHNYEAFDYTLIDHSGFEGTTIVSPDAGSLKKIYKFAQYHKCDRIIKADKVRDTKTGDIISTEVYCDNLQGEDVTIVDDICDGGRTFIELAKKLKEKGAGKITLVVTHGIFSKGLNVFDGLIDKIMTTNSFYDGESTDFIEVFPIW
jgi:ribose-phosphate pyrophosphokinase